jgi:hypothetical protein
MTINLDQYTNTLSVTDTAANADLTYVTKGTGTHVFNTGGGTQFRVPNVNSAVNYVQAYGAVTGGAVSLESAGADANIWVNYSAKGTGNHQFLTNSAVQMRIANTTSAVNYVQATGAATGSGPTISAQGSDTNLDLNVTAKGTGGARFNVGNGVKYTYLSSDAANNTQLIGAVGGNLGIYSTSAGSIRFYTTTGLAEEQLRISQTVSAVNYVQVTGAATGGQPTISAQGSDSNVQLNFAAKGASGFDFQNSATAGAFGIELAGNTSVDKITFIDFHSSAGTDFDFRLARQGGVNNFITYVNAGTGGHAFQTAGGTEQLRVSHTASAVNYVQVTGAATGGIPTISSQGSDTNINLVLSPKGSAVVAVSSELRVATAAVNFFQMYGSGSGSGPVFASIGSDTNIDLNLTPKGTGKVRFGTHTGTADTAVSGYIEIKDSSGTIRKLAVIT